MSAPYSSDGGDQQQHLEHGELCGQRHRLAPVDADRVDTRDTQRVERAVVGLDRERPLDEHEQAEQRRQPDQTRARPAAITFVSSSANANISIVPRQTEVLG